MIHSPTSISDRVALGLTKFFRFFADTFFAKRYGHRAVVLETIAGVPGMVGGMCRYVGSVNKMKDDPVIMELLEEAENERMHLMTFIRIARPSLLERVIILLAQAGFWIFYFFLYLFFRKTAHRMVGYFEEEAVRSYTEYLNEIESGNHENVPAPQIAIDYWDLDEDARLSDVVKAVRDDEAGHSITNHKLAN